MKFVFQFFPPAVPEASYWLRAKALFIALSAINVAMKLTLLSPPSIFFPHCFYDIATEPQRRHLTYVPRRRGRSQTGWEGFTAECLADHG